MDYNRLKELRVSRHISQKELAERLGVSQQTVASWEVGRTEPSNIFLSSLSKVFNVSADYLLGNDQSRKTLPITNEERTLLSDFKSLTADGQNMILGMLNSLKVTHSATA